MTFLSNHALSFRSPVSLTCAKCFLTALYNCRKSGVQTVTLLLFYHSLSPLTARYNCSKSATSLLIVIVFAWPVGVPFKALLPSSFKILLRYSSTTFPPRSSFQHPHIHIHIHTYKTQFPTPTMAEKSITFSPREMEVLALAWQCMEAQPKVRFLVPSPIPTYPTNISKR
jgi:hypothetical protein